MIAVGAEPQMGVGELAAVLRRRCGLIIAIVILGTALVGCIGFLIPPHYTAKAQVVVEPQLVNLIGGQPVAINQPADEAALMTELTAIKSHDLLERVLDSLASHSVFRDSVSPARGGTAEVRQQLWARLSDWLPRAVVKWLSGPTWLTLPLLERHLNVFQEQGSHVIAVGYTSSDPQEAAAIANRITQIYLEQHVAQQRAGIDNALAWFDRRIPELAERVQQLDTKLQQDQTVSGLGDASQTNLMGQLFDVNRQLLTAEADLRARQARYESIRARQVRGEDIVKFLDTPALDELRRREAELLQVSARMSGVGYRDANPVLDPIRGQLQSIRQEMARAAQAAIVNQASDVQAMTAQVNALRQRVTALQQASTDPKLQALGREVVTSRQLYASLEQRREQLREQREGLSPTVQLLSMAAPPERPSSPSPILFIPPAAVLFAMFGGFTALLLERLDTTLRSTRDVVDHAGLPCVGLVPRLLGRNRPHRCLLERPFAPYSEAIRAVVAGLQLTSSPNTSDVILVTSSLPGEGKTTLAVSLAVYVAQLPRRVLLIDMDFRRPAVLRELVGTADVSVADLLLSNWAAAENIRHLPEYKLDCLPLRRGPGVDPVKLFATEQLPRLLEQLRTQYDCIVIDSAPLMAVTETRLLAQLADMVLLGIRWGRTHRKVASNAVALLADPLSYQGKPPPRLASALTQVDLKRHARYRSGDSGEFLVEYARYYSTEETRALPDTPPHGGNTMDNGQPSRDRDA
jgi:polysaccharide biosynthesis transport protein